MTRVPEALDALLGRERVRVVDVGARGGWPRKWQTMRPWVTLIVSNPRPMSLNASGTQLHAMKCTWLMSCIGRTPRSSSITPGIPSVARSTGPNRALIQRLRPGDDRLDVVRSESIPVTTLDNALERAGIRSVDFLKLDTQGSELDILHGGVRTLEDGVLGVEVEVEFLPLYEGQPLFPDVHQFMVRRGFELMDFPKTRSVADFGAGAIPRASRLAATSRWLRSRLASRGRYGGAKQLLYAAQHVHDRCSRTNRMPISCWPGRSRCPARRASSAMHGSSSTRPIGGADHRHATP
jgi:FkbM family methyltransferase